MSAGFELEEGEHSDHLTTTTNPLIVIKLIHRNKYFFNEI